MPEAQTLKRAAARHFDSWADHYEQGRMSRWFRHFQSMVIAAAAPHPGQRLLDLGCGTGWAVRTIARQEPRAFACGVDISRVMLRQARRLCTSAKIGFVQADSEHLPCADASFDVVICSSSFHHYPNPVASLREILRVLRPGGVFLLLETSREAFWPIALYDFVQRSFRRDHVRYYATPEIVAFMRAAGFQEVTEVMRERGFFRHGKLVTSEVLIRAVKR
ncbi:MAG: class I SAM-dependent methyltransferase [candidate division KSB1 bacterium]|nr:class I SAM-dependent methyltransferase [candidate division KSB1 bacterium]MDZ7295442.1 class I SAM-dependent methyltransferase [candidate division KSB1 bacterium]MDZ7384757.1 class I SAM-dependent methyltransferase [candidate division KSB1 bacterium]MDZ7391278.1 class I SAM-dependent methyltransferase [candidate division KSB1 bacterium]MDZ7412003.1 class I SAM-dependent methyltransferase [candidate division KSB1 bacterium]